MSAEQMVIAGKGPVILGVYDPTTGVAHEGYLVNQKRIGCGNRTLKISHTRTSKKVQESCSGQSLTLKKWTANMAATCLLEMVQFSREEMALGLYGSSIARVAGTVTDEAMRSGLVADDLVHTKHPNVSSLVVTDSAGTPGTLVADTNYSLDSAPHGRIKIIDPGSFTQPFKTAYAYADYGQVTALTAASTRRGIIFDGINVAEGNAPVRVIIPLVDFDPAKDFNWLSDDEAVLSLEGEILYCDALAGNSDFGPFYKVDALPQ